MLINVRVGLGWDVSPYSANHQQTTYSVTLPTFRVTGSLSRSSSQRSQASAVEWPYSHRGGRGVYDDNRLNSPGYEEKRDLPVFEFERRRGSGYLRH